MLIRKLGHDGSQVIRPELSVPGCYLGFHIQELITAAWEYGYAVTPFEAKPRSHVNEGTVAEINFPGGNVERMLKILESGYGVLTGQALPSGNHHAVAWDGYRVFDPIGQVKTLNDFAIVTYWRITPK